MLLAGQPPGLLGIAQGSQQQADACRRQDRSEQKAVGEAEHPAAQADDQQDLNEVVQAQPEETVEITVLNVEPLEVVC